MTYFHLKILAKFNMRQLILMRGTSSSGKSTIIKKLGLEALTISSDVIRLIIQSPMMTLSGMEISQKNNRKVWALIMQTVEDRMTRGEFVLVDATHRTSSEINNYKSLCEKYRYRCTICEMDVDVKKAKELNLKRVAHEIVPAEVIDAQASLINSQKVPAWVKVISQHELEDALAYKIEDYNHWTKIHHIGDIQGCYDPLEEYFNKFGYPKDKLDELYIFTGDMLDRGIQNGEVMELILSIFELPNVMIIEGNHEHSLSNWAHDLELRSDEFRNFTKPQLEANGISKKKVKYFIRRLRQMIYYNFNNVSVLVSHGGLSRVPEKPLLIPTIQYIKGIGDYSTDIDEIWNNLRSVCDDRSLVYQVHGHRNINDTPTVNNLSFNLEGRVEYFGHLRIVVLTKEGWEVRDEKSYNCKIIPVPTESKLLRELRTNKYVDEKKFGDVCSFNFSRDAFYSKKWNDTTTKARGLFINTQSNEIVARSYDKFFNVGEFPHTEWQSLEKTLIFPVTLFEKENGFLGIAGWDTERGCKIIASKSSLTGEFAGWFSDILLNELGDKTEAFFQFLNIEKLSAVFEVIDPIRDPHIVEYTESKVVLLDLVYRTEKFENVEYENLSNIALAFNLQVKKLVNVFDNFESLKEYIDIATPTLKIEGVLLRDASNFMTKIKYDWYAFWKQMRVVKDGLVRGHKTKTQFEHQPFVIYMSTLQLEQISNMSIIQLRNQYEIFMSSL